MKGNFSRVGMVAGALLGSFLVHAAAAAGPGFYVKAEAGPNIVQDVRTRTDGGNSVGDFGFDVGLRFAAVGGYRFTSVLAAELETGVLYNQVDRSGDAWLNQIPILANAVFRFENFGRFVPFIGGGAGGVASFLHLDFRDERDNDSDNDFVFAWQGFGGFDYTINDHISVGGEYKYLGIDGPEFSDRDRRISLDTIHNHAFLGSFDWSF